MGLQGWFCAGGVALRHGHREEAHLEEIAPEQRTRVLKAYLKRAPNAGAHLPIDKEAPPTEFQRCRTDLPCFG